MVRMSLIETIKQKYIKERNSLVMVGVCGNGKTHAMTALGLEACNRDYKVRFHTASELVTLPKHARVTRTLDRACRQLERQDLPCLDEFGKLPMDPEGGRMLFEVISSAYERQSLIIATNLPFNAWGPLFADEQLAAAMIDRIVHYGHLIDTGNKDWRLSSSPMNRTQVMELRK
jgi:DNA replication protein DnaC